MEDTDSWPPLPSSDELDAVERVFMARAGARIRELRLYKGYSIAEIGKVHRIDDPWFKQIEEGLETLTARSAVRVAIALGVEPYELFFEPSGEVPVPLKPAPALPPAPERTELTHHARAFMAQIGQRIRHFRIIQGMSLEMLTEYTGIDRKSVGLIESGTTNLRARSAVKLSLALGVLPHELYLPRDQSGIRAKEAKPSAKETGRG